MKKCLTLDKNIVEGTVGYVLVVCENNNIVILWEEIPLSYSMAHPHYFGLGLHKNVITALVSHSHLTEDNFLYPDQI